MSERSIGWAFVAAQAFLLGLLVAVPDRSDFGLPDVVRVAANVVFWVGIAVAVVAGLSLGRALTATPVPNADGELRTTGPYRLARHPIYTGVILVVVALAVRSQSFPAVSIAVVTLAFFGAKARWEESRLVDRYPEYSEYARRTPRFIPIRGRRR